MGPRIKVVFLKKSTCGSHEQCMGLTKNRWMLDVQNAIQTYTKYKKYDWNCVMPQNIIKCLILLRKPIPCSHAFPWWSKETMACLAVSIKILLKICSSDFCALWISSAKCSHAFSCCFVVYSFNICWCVIVLCYSFSVLVAKALVFDYHPMFWLLHIIRYNILLLASYAAIYGC